MVTRSIVFGPSAATSATKSPIGSETGMPTNGTIRRIRIVGFQGVTDKGEQAILIIETNLQKGPWEFACYAAGSEITVGGKRATEEIEVEIPVRINEKISVFVNAAESLEDVTVSLLYT